MNSPESIGLGLFRRMVQTGRLELTTPQGAYSIGSGTPVAGLALHDYSAVRDVLRTGLLGFTEAYMDGRVDTPDLRGLFTWAVANQRAWFDHPLAKLTYPLRRAWQRIRPEKFHPRVESMNDHYNLGNDFYAAWLDETMTYSSARFTHPDESLEDAQRNKYRTIADQLALKPGMRVLEIGCGWGGFAAYAAGERGCDVVGITLSTEQAAYAEKRVAAGLAGQVEIRLQDFRNVTGEFDAIASIEMIESIDEAQWPPLFEAIRHRLAPEARAAMQIITIDDAVWESYRSRADFIQQYIFPGGQLPAPKVLSSLADSVGLKVEQVETFGLDYARTLLAWRERFTAAWPDLASEHDLDERFRRMWDLYLTLCEAGFRMRRIDVEHWVFSR
jgi:cyclopropane-fatty-acyl-phospholipid synthase